MISSISMGAMLSLLLIAANARALPQQQAPQQQAPPQQQQQEPQVQVQRPAPTQSPPIGSFTANVYSAMRNNPSEPAGVLISLPYQTTTVTVTAPTPAQTFAANGAQIPAVQTVTITAFANAPCFSSVATPPQAPQQPGNGIVASMPQPQPTAVIPNPSTIPAGVFPPVFPSNNLGLLPFMPTGTGFGTGSYPTPTAAFVSAVLPGIESSVAVEMKSLLNPLQSQLSFVATHPGTLPTSNPVAQQIVTVTAQIPVPTTVVNTVSVPTTIVNTVQIPTTIEKSTTVTQTLNAQPTTVIASITVSMTTGLSAIPTGASIAPFPLPSGDPNAGLLPAGTGLSSPSGVNPTGAALSSPTGIHPTGPLPTGVLPTGMPPTGSSPLGGPTSPQETAATNPLSPSSSSINFPLQNPPSTNSPPAELPPTGQAGQTGQTSQTGQTGQPSQTTQSNPQIGAIPGTSFAQSTNVNR